MISEETRRKMSLARIGKAPWNKGKKCPHSIGWGEMISKRLKGVKKPPRTPEHARKIGDANRGRKKTPQELEKLRSYEGYKRYNYKGENVSYGGLHTWVTRKLGRPDFCEHCKRSDLPHRSYNWANKSNEYKRDVSDWLRLCVQCHRKYDKSIKI